MSFFKHTLKEIEALLTKGEFDNAKQILEEHINAELHFHSDLMGLHGVLGSYIQSIRNAHQMIERSHQSPVYTPHLIRHIQHAKSEIQRAEAIIEKLKREAKLELR